MKRYVFYLLAFLITLSLPLLNLADTNTWTRKADMPTARSCLSTSTVNGKIYAIGGIGGRVDEAKIVFSTVEEYDPVTGTWTKKADMPTARWALSTSVVNEKIYVIGGCGDKDATVILSTVEEYDPVSDTWTKKASMPTSRFRFSTSVVNGKIYAIGGLDNDFLAVVEEYDAVTDTWTKKANMLVAKFNISTSAVNGKIYVIGGTKKGPNWQFIDVPIVEEYNPLSDTWTKKANILNTRAAFSTSAVNGKVYAIGDAIPVEEYNPVTNKWTKKADIPTARHSLSTSVVDGRIYAIGGMGKDNTYLSTVEEYDTGFTGKGVEPAGKITTSWGKIKVGY